VIRPENSVIITQRELMKGFVRDIKPRGRRTLHFALAYTYGSSPCSIFLAEYFPLMSFMRRDRWILEVTWLKIKKRVKIVIQYHLYTGC